MADDLTAGGSADPTVTLTADAGPFERGLDKAAAKLSSWGSAIESRFGKIAEGVKGKTAKLTGFLGAVNEKAEGGMDAAGAIGTVLGGAIGTSIGGPIGAAIGAQIGAGLMGALGESVDFGALLGGANGFKAAVEREVGATKDAWAGFKYSAQARLNEVREAFGGLNLAELIRGDAESAAKKLEAAFGRATDRVELLVGQGMARVADRINGAFDAVKEPVAQVADVLQAVGEQLGLVDGATAKWGDNIRGLEDVGLKAMRVLGAAVGYVEAAFVKLGATVVRAVQRPVAEALGAVLGQAREALKWAAENTPDWAGGAKFSRWAAGLEGVEDRVRKLGEGADEWAAAALARPWEEFAKERADKFEAMVGRGRAQNAIDDELRNRKGPDAGGGDRGGPMKAVQALIGGSSGAAQAVIAAQRSTANAAAMGPQEKAVAKLEDLNQKQAAAVGKLDDLGKKLDALNGTMEALAAT